MVATAASPRSPGCWLTLTLYHQDRFSLALLLQSGWPGLAHTPTQVGGEAGDQAQELGSQIDMGLNPGLATYYLCGLGQRVCLRLLTCKITGATPTGLCKSRDRMYVNRVEGRLCKRSKFSLLPLLC